MTDKYGCRTLTGAEFQQAAAQATPLENITGPYAHRIPRPFGEMPSGIGRRHEDKNAIRGCK